MAKPSAAQTLSAMPEAFVSDIATGPPSRVLPACGTGLCA